MRDLGPPILAEMDGNAGSIFGGVDAHDHSGTVSAAGDVNGDGFDDFLIGAPNAGLEDGRPEAGETYLV